MYFATMGKFDSESYTFFKIMNKIADMFREEDMSFIAAIGFNPVVYQIVYFSSVIGLATQFIVCKKIKTEKNITLDLTVNSYMFGVRFFLWSWSVCVGSSFF